MTDLLVTYDAVIEILEGLSPSSSAGADGIHPSLLHNCSAVIALPLSIIINKSLFEGVLPAEWKHSRVAPIHKSGSKFNPLNYRPVSVTSAPCKVAERLLANHIISYLEEMNLLSGRQFGFRKGRSTEDQLLLSYGKIAKEVDRGRIVDAVYLDYSKAFDVLSHQILIEKAESIGFSPQILNWIRSFLFGRVMQVSVNGMSSNPRSVCSGVPQGSVLGPLLFIIYVNSLGVNFNCEWYSFADDMKIFASKPKLPLLAVDPALQEDLNNLYTISSSWNLKLNPNKCVLMRFGGGNYIDGEDSGYVLGGTGLNLVKTHRDLGVLIDLSLRFHPHISEIIRKSSGLANQLLRATVCRSPIFMVTLFISHIRPLIEYCSTLWNYGYLGDVRKLESVQRRWTANVAGMEELNYPERLNRLNLFSIQGRLLRSDLIKIWKAFWSGIDTGLMEMFERQFHRSTRGHSCKLSLPVCHSDTLRRFLTVRSVEVWNSLPVEVVEAQTIYAFKSGLDRHMHQQFFATII
ncbi:MAG: reverse transcriptase family protein [Bacteroidota bacterium]